MKKQKQRARQLSRSFSARCPAAVPVGVPRGTGKKSSISAGLARVSHEVSRCLSHGFCRCPTTVPLGVPLKNGLGHGFGCSGGDRASPHPPLRGGVGQRACTVKRDSFGRKKGISDDRTIVRQAALAPHIFDSQPAAPHVHEVGKATLATRARI